jgi:hypothetical protein
MCEVRLQLLATYQAAVDRYLDSVRDLRSKTATASRSDYVRLMRASETNREQSESARRNLVEHMQSHRCFPKS